MLPTFGVQVGPRMARAAKAGKGCKARGGGIAESYTLQKLSRGFERDP